MDREQAELTRKQGYDVWTDKQRKLAPYQGLGQASAGTLGNLMGFKPATMAVAEPTAAVPYTPYKTESLIPGSVSGTTTPTSGTLGSLAMPQAPSTLGSAASPQSTGMVWMKAPDGSTKQVPSFAIPHYQRLGATVVSTPSWQTGAVA